MAVRVGSVGPPIRADTMEPEVFRQALNALLGSGQGIVLDSTVGGPLAVTQNGTPNMSVNVAAGFAFIRGTQSVPAQGAYLFFNDATVNLAIAASNPSNPRIDVVAASIQDAYYSGASNTALLQVITGTPGASPAVPALPANSIALAHIYVGASASSIVTANINSTAGSGNPDTTAFVPPVAGGGEPAIQRSMVASVPALQTTASTVYVDLATVGPTVSVVTGTSALVMMGMVSAMGAANAINFMAPAVSGASTVAAADANALQQSHATSGGVEGSSQITLLTELTPGTNVFTAKYKTNAGTASIQARTITVFPLA